MTLPNKTLAVVGCLLLSSCASSTAEPATSAPAGTATTTSPATAPVARPATATSPPSTAATKAPATPVASASSPSAVTFTAVQAGRGRDVFRATCTECHYSSEFRDAQFKFKWRRRSAGDLFEHILTSMPEDSPGSLELRQYADVVAYILQMNGFEPGATDLPADADLLAGLSLAPFGN